MREEDGFVVDALTTRGIHHLRLTVTDVQRSQSFYINLLGFQVFAEMPPGVLLSNGTLFLGLGPPPSADRSMSDDRFDENRVGLDHLSFAVDTRTLLEEAIKLFDESGVPHSEITDLPDLGMSQLVFRDPDNIQLELTAPSASTT